MATGIVKGRRPKEQKRGHGEGSIYQRSENSWAGITRYVDPDTGISKKHYVYGKSRKEVVEKKKAFEDELKKGIIPRAGKITVKSWLEDWMKVYKKNGVRQNTFEDYKRVVDAHLIPSIGTIQLKDLRPQQVQKMLNEKLEGGRTRTDNIGKKGGPLSPRTVQYIYTVLHMALEQAVKNGLIIRNVCDAVDKPKKAKYEALPWTTEQTNTFLSSVKDDRFFPVYMIAWGGGLRRSEILGLKWDDVDLKKGTLTVRRTLVRIKGGYRFGEPKTPKSRRTIPLPGSVIDALKAWKAVQAQENLSWKGKFKDLPEAERPKYNPLNMVFCNEAGQSNNPDEISRAFKKALLNAKLPNIRFHDLRHGHATMLLELGEDIKVISERLGHSSIVMTGDIYAHVREKQQRQASDKLDKALDLG